MAHEYEELPLLVQRVMVGASLGRWSCAVNQDLSNLSSHDGQGACQRTSNLWIITDIVRCGCCRTSDSEVGTAGSEVGTARWDFRQRGGHSRQSHRKGFQQVWLKARSQDRNQFSDTTC